MEKEYFDEYLFQLKVRVLFMVIGLIIERFAKDIFTNKELKTFNKNLNSSLKVK
jgi:hypothetical protein